MDPTFSRQFFVCFEGRKVFSNATSFFVVVALVRADFTTGQIAYIWIHATLNTVYFGDLSEASAWKTRGFWFEKAILIQTDSDGEARCGLKCTEVVMPFIPFAFVTL